MKRKNKRKTGYRILAFLLMLLAVITAAGCSSKIALKNADFSAGSGDQFSKWSQYNYRQSEDADSFRITRVQDETHGSCVRISNLSENDARIYQEVRVGAGKIYKVTAEVRIDGTLEGGAGFVISALETFGQSEGVFTTQDTWQTVTAYLKTAKGQHSLNLSFGIGGYGAETAGTVMLASVSAEEVKGAPEGVSLVDTAPYTQQKKDDEAVPETPLAFQILFLALVAGLVLYVLLLIKRHDTQCAEKGLSLSEKPVRFRRTDAILLAVLTAIGAIASFYKLGDTQAANRCWTPVNAGEYVTVEFPETVSVSRTTISPGVPQSSAAAYEVEYEGDDGEYRTAFSFARSNAAFYEWHLQNTAFTAKRVRVRVRTCGMSLNEMAFWTQEESGAYRQIPVTVIETFCADARETERPEALFDEQELAQVYRTFENGTYFDEIYFPRTAYEHLNGLSIYEITHPPLGKTIISIGISLFGMNPFGWRFMGTFMGVLLIPLMYLLALKLFKKSSLAFTAAFLMLFDFMRTTQTRLATIDTYSVFFIILMYYFMYDYFSRKSYEWPFWQGMLSMALSGLCFGLGAACKWTSIYAGVGLAILFFMAKFAEAADIGAGRYEDGKGRKSWFLGNFIPTCLLCVVFFVLIPLGIYVLSYLPYMPSNPGKSLISVVMENQKYMYNYHSGLTSTHAYQSSWYSWIIDGRPIYYYSSANAGLAAGIRASVVSMGNPAIWWTGLACIIPALYFAWKRREKAMIPVFIGYACQLFPWILVTRCTFIYHYFTAVPFLILMIVYVIKVLLEDQIVKKPVVITYLVLVALLYVLFYPVMVGIPVKEAYISALRWFSTWTF